MTDFALDPVMVKALFRLFALLTLLSLAGIMLMSSHQSRYASERANEPLPAIDRYRNVVLDILGLVCIGATAYLMHTGL